MAMRHYRSWRADRSARLKANNRPADLPLDAECKTCANLPGLRAHSCPATQWLLDEPVCDDCAAGLTHQEIIAQRIRERRARRLARERKAAA